MLKFSSYIIESTNIPDVLEGLKKYKPLITDKFGPKLDSDIEILKKGAEDKLIYNARYGDATRGILTFIERVYRVIEKSLMGFRNDNKSVDLPYSLYTVSDIKKLAKDATKVGNLPAPYKEFVDTVKDIPDVFAILKGYVQKGKPPAEPKPGQFIKPVISFDASKLAVKFITEATESFASELKTNLTNEINKAYNKIKDYKNPSQLSNDHTEQALASRIFIVKTNQERKKYLELKSDSKEIINRMIENNYRDILDSFIGKNASKLALILQKKGVPKEHKILRTNIKNGMVENSMSFEFEDSSSFILESSVIYKYSNMGKLFFQYPTRFKNVKLSDGTLMKMPSEEKMIKEF